MLKLKDQSTAQSVAFALVVSVEGIAQEFRAEALEALERFAFLLFDKSPLGSQTEAFGEELMVRAQGAQDVA